MPSSATDSLTKALAAAAETERAHRRERERALERERRLNVQRKWLVVCMCAAVVLFCLVCMSLLNYYVAGTLWKPALSLTGPVVAPGGAAR